MTNLPPHTRVVIVGGGIVGCSIAYHLALRGVSDVVLLERKELTSGTTWHAAGLVGQLRATQNLTRLAKYTTELFATLEEDTGQATGFQTRGSVAVAANAERFEELRRGASMARVFGLPVEVIEPTDIERLVPQARTDDLIGGVYLPGRRCDESRSTRRGRSPRVPARVGCTDLREHSGHADPRRGRIALSGSSTRSTVSGASCAPTSWSTPPACGGASWAHRSASTVPLHAAEHFYIVTDSVDGGLADDAGAPRPGRLWVLQVRAGQAARRVVRAGGQAVGDAAARRAAAVSPSRSASAPCRRTSSTSRR